MAIQTFNSVDGFSVGNSQIMIIDGVANVSANSLSVSANANITGNLTAIGNITGNYFIGNGSQLTDLPSGGIEYVYKTSAYTVTTNQGVLADTTGGVFTVTLPATPATGDQCVVADAGGVFGTNNCTVARNGSTIAGIAQDLALDIDGVSVQFVYDGTTWNVYSQVGGAGGTAGAYGNTQVTAYLESGISGNINPSANVTYSLGNVDRQWSELWVANSTIYIGGVPLSVTGNVLFVDGEPVLSNDSTTNIATSGNISSANLTVTGSISNSRIVIRVVSTTTGSSLTINGDTTDQYEVTALAEATTINAPTGTPTDGQRLTIRIDDNGSAQSLSWNPIFRVIGTTLPATTVAGKTVYIGCIYNEAKTKWDVVSVAQEA